MSSRIQDAWRAYAALDRRIWILAAVRAVNTMGLALVMAFMAIYLVTDRGISGQAYGWIYFVANICQSLAQGYAGELSDRVGRGRIMIGALLCRAAVIVGLGVMVLASAPIALLAVTLVVSASLRGGFEPVAYAVVADVARSEERVAAFGLQKMGVNLGWAIGPALGGLLAARLPYGAVFFCAAPVLLLAAWATSRVASVPRGTAPPARVSLREALREASGRADLSVFLLCAFLFALMHVQLFSTLSIYGSGVLGLSKDEIGVVWMVNGLAVLLAQVPAVGLIGRLGYERALVVGAAFYWVGFAGFGLAGGQAALAGAVLIVTAGEVLLTPAQQAVATQLGDPARLGRAFGLLGTMQMLGVAVAPLAGGLAYDYLRHRPFLMWGGALGALCVLLVAGYVLFTVLRSRARLQGSGEKGPE